MLIMTTMTTTVTIPSAPPRPPPPPSPPHQQQQQPQQRHFLSRRACSNKNNNNTVTTSAVKCHRNYVTSRGDIQEARGSSKRGEEVPVDNVTIASPAQEAEEKTPTKRNWVLSDNFYLLESPKTTWRDDKQQRTVAAAPPKLVNSRRQLNAAFIDSVDCCAKNGNCDEWKQYGHRQAASACEAAAAAANRNGLHRSLRNLLDFREAGDTSVS